LAVSVGIPTGLLLTRRAAWKRPVLAVANVLQTVPSLALLALLIPLRHVGIEWRPAVIALFLYALLPVIRNTVTGIEGVDRNIREAAVAMGMTDGQVLRQVELPLAAPVILAGVRVATVISVGIATIAAFIGAGGLGVYIQRGLRQYDNNLLLAGAIPAALLALAADAGIGLIESRLDVRRRAARGAHKKSVLRRFAWAALALAVYEQVKREYAERFDIEVSPPLGFEDTFAILVRSTDARRLNLKTISDVIPYAPKWRAGFGQDFMSRKDGYEGFARAYDLQFAERPREMDLSLSYRALADRGVDIIAGNSTDGMIATLGLTQLEDDRHYFPPYEAV